MHMEVVKPKTPDGATTGIQFSSHAYTLTWSTLQHYPLGGSTFGWARVYGLDRLINSHMTLRCLYPTHYYQSINKQPTLFTTFSGQSYLLLRFSVTEWSEFLVSRCLHLGPGTSSIATDIYRVYAVQSSFVVISRTMCSEKCVGNLLVGTLVEHVSTMPVGLNVLHQSLAPTSTVTRVIIAEDASRYPTTFNFAVKLTDRRCQIGTAVI